jgi:hypothetical protein
VVIVPNTIVPIPAFTTVVTAGTRTTETAFSTVVKTSSYATAVRP